MISVKFKDKEFMSTMNNFMNYSYGFLDGAQQGREKLLNKLGKEVIEKLKDYVDSMARVSPQTLHHVYEWNQVGSPAARLFDLNYRADKKGISFNYTFSQSRSVRSGSTTPFYDKARIMEEGIPVTISPVFREALRFEKDGQEVFVKGPVTVNNPGGSAVQGGFENTISTFFESYFTQSFLMISGVLAHLDNLKEYREGLSKVSGGHSAGVAAGMRWSSQEGRFVSE